MDTKPLTYTVTMDAHLAKEVGVPAAMLYNLLAWQAQTPMAQDYDDDGWFYCTAEYFEEKTTFNRNTFTKAIKALEDVGLIECQRMYVKYGYKNTNKSVNHFRVIQRIDEFLCTRNVRGTHTKCEYNNIKEKIKEESQITPTGDDLASPQSSTNSAPKEDFSFGADTEKVSIRPSKKETDSSKRPFAVGQQVLKAWGYKSARVSAPLANKFKVWLDSGFTPEQIIEAGELMKKSGDKYWETATPIQMVSENGLLWYQEHRKEAILKSVPYTIIGGRYYEIDPQTGRPIKEIKL